MLQNIGGKIKIASILVLILFGLVAIVFFFVGIILAGSNIGYGLDDGDFLFGLFLLLIAFFSAVSGVVAALLVYGFGKLLEDVEAIRARTERGELDNPERDIV